MATELASAAANAAVWSSAADFAEVDESAGFAFAFTAPVAEDDCVSI